jgi:hypothetical protein
LSSFFIVLRVFVLRFRLGISIVLNLGITAAFSFLVDFLDLSFFLPLAKAGVFRPPADAFFGAVVLPTRSLLCGPKVLLDVVAFPSELAFHRPTKISQFLYQNPPRNPVSGWRNASISLVFFSSGHASWMPSERCSILSNAFSSPRVVCPFSEYSARTRWISDFLPVPVPLAGEQHNKSDRSHIS